MTCSHRTAIGMRNVKTRVVHQECVRCGDWLPFHVYTSTRVPRGLRQREDRLARSLADIARLWEPGRERTELERLAVDFYATDWSKP